MNSSLTLSLLRLSCQLRPHRCYPRQHLPGQQPSAWCRLREPPSWLVLLTLQLEHRVSVMHHETDIKKPLLAYTLYNIFSIINSFSFQWPTIQWKYTFLIKNDINCSKIYCGWSNNYNIRVSLTLQINK